MSNRNYWVLCDDNCRFPAMTKEQILTAIAQAVETGEIHDIDAGFITTIQTINGVPLRFFVGSQSEYETLTEDEKQGLFAIITNDTTKEGIENAIKQLQSEHEALAESLADGSFVVANATNATSVQSFNVSNLDELKNVMTQGKKCAVNFTSAVTVKTVTIPQYSKGFVAGYTDGSLIAIDNNGNAYRVYYAKSDDSFAVAVSTQAETIKVKDNTASIDELWTAGRYWCAAGQNTPNASYGICEVSSRASEYYQFFYDFMKYGNVYIRKGNKNTETWEEWKLGDAKTAETGKFKKEETSSFFDVVFKGNDNEFLHSPYLRFNPAAGQLLASSVKAEDGFVGTVKCSAPSIAVTDANNKLPSNGYYFIAADITTEKGTWRQNFGLVYHSGNVAYTYATGRDGIDLRVAQNGTLDLTSNVDSYRFFVSRLPFQQLSIS